MLCGQCKNVNKVQQQKDKIIIMNAFELGLSLLNNQHDDKAQIQFEHVVIQDASHALAWFYLGVLALKKGYLQDALDCFRTVLSLNPNDVEAWVNSGVVLLQQHEPQMAIHEFSKALSIDPNHEAARNNLAATFVYFDRFENALVHYNELLKSNPNHMEYAYNAAVCEMALGHLDAAITLYEKILRQNPKHFATLNNMAAIHNRLDQHQKTKDFLERALAVQPDNETCSFMLNALTHQDNKPASCTTYVRHLFNDYAIHYEQHMNHALGYTLSHHIASVLHQMPLFNVPKALDLGCGTGLTGIVLRELCQYLIGIDVSSKMLTKAQEKDIYDELFEAEAVAWLKQNAQHYDLVVAADVLPYVGDLAPLMEILSQRIQPKGYFICTFEISECEDWSIQETARFCHHPEYVVSLAKQFGFNLKSEQKVAGRQHQGQDLHVVLCVFERSQEAC